jgi:hypothetical protein
MTSFLEEVKANKENFAVSLGENEIIVLKNGQCVGRVRLKEDFASNSF